ncbi:MAG: DNA replication/repair protein RecF [Pseudomonadota bacterium]
MPASHVRSLRLTNFRNYAKLSLEPGPQPVILVGSNGAGKTNLLEAVSLLAPGQGLRRVPFPDLARLDGDGTWSVAATLETDNGPVAIGTGLIPGGAPGAMPGRASRGGRTVRIDGETASGSGALADYLEMVWLTPAMDGLFTGPAGDRRRFLDRLTVCIDPGYRRRVGIYERAMRQRNRLLEAEHATATIFDGLELQLAEAGIAMAATRAETVARINAHIETRRADMPESPFPWADLRLEGDIEDWLATMPALDAEDRFRRALAADRPRERAARRTLTGPHRSDLLVRHGPKDMPAKLSSTGEQKALLINLVLAHASLVRAARGNAAPILLLDEIAAHLDPGRRAALFDEVVDLGTQAWLTGTDRAAFDTLDGRATGYIMEAAEIIDEF